jgi:hypothetical protein
MAIVRGVPSGLTSVVEGSYPHQYTLAKRIEKKERERKRKVGVETVLWGCGKGWFELARELDWWRGTSNHRIC